MENWFTQTGIWKTVIHTDRHLENCNSCRLAYGKLWFTQHWKNCITLQSKDFFSYTELRVIHKLNTKRCPEDFQHLIKYHWPTNLRKWQTAHFKHEENVHRSGICSWLIDACTLLQWSLYNIHTHLTWKYQFNNSRHHLM